MHSPCTDTASMRAVGKSRSASSTSNSGEFFRQRRAPTRRTAGSSRRMSGEHSSSRTSLRPVRLRRSGSAATQSNRSVVAARYSSAEAQTTSTFAAPSSRRLRAATAASTGSRSSATTRRKRRPNASASTPSPQVRSSAASPARLLVCGARLARRLFEGARRQDAACGVVGGEFRAGAFEVFDLRGHQRGVGCAPVERHGQRIAAEILLHGAPHVVAAQRIELFACHAGKVTDFSATDGMPRG